MLTQKRKESLAGYGFLAPGLLLYAMFLLLPIVVAMLFSVTSLNRLTWDIRFVGAENFDFVLSDPLFWASFRNTATFVVLAVAGNVGVGLVLAGMLDRRLPSWIMYFLRLSYFLPVLVSTATIAIVWRLIYSTDLGILNYYLTRIGLPRVGWLTDASVALNSIVLFDVWKHCGFFMIILLAALQSVPRSLVEAASLDGAGPIRIFCLIKLPMIAPVVLFCIIFQTINALQVFDQVRILTNGGPGAATRSVVMHMYEEAFSAHDLGTGSATALILLSTILAVTAVQLYLSRRYGRR